MTLVNYSDFRRNFRVIKCKPFSLGRQKGKGQGRGVCVCGGGGGGEGGVRGGGHGPGVRGNCVWLLSVNNVIYRMQLR